MYPEEHCNDTHLGQRNNERAVPVGFTSDLFCGGDTKGTEGVCQVREGAQNTLRGVINFFLGGEVVQTLEKYGCRTTHFVN